MMKFIVLQEVVNKRYNVYQYVPSHFYDWKRKNGSIVTKSNNISYWIDYNIESRFEIVDREVIDHFEKNDMVYKVGDELWYKDEIYKIKDIIHNCNETKLYIDKQRIDKEIGEEEAKELLKEIDEIKLRQKTYREQEENKVKSSKEIITEQETNQKYFIPKIIKRLLKRRI